MRWHFLRTAPADGARNMAMDEALMRRAARAGDAVFRVYGWSVPTLSLGRHQRARDAYDADAARAAGVAFVRRPTGGRALLHHHEVTYSATLPAPAVADARAAYEFVNDVLLSALDTLGVGARRATATVALPPGLRPCFDAPADGEIVVGHRKLVGSAQWRHGGALLQHGSILVRDDQAVIDRLLATPGAAVPAAATLADALGREPALAEVADVMAAALERVAGAPVSAFDEAHVADDAAALRLRYADAAWTWRR